MSARCASIRLGLGLAASALLAACAIQPTKPPPQPATVIAHPESSTTIAPLATEGEPWASLTATFVLQDCADDPLIRSLGAMYTRSPARFEQLLRESLPLMMYVQRQLRTAGIPGEFAMLPMLESSYAPHEPSRRGDPAGMWQLMPRTAHLHGVVVNGHYDGRLDPVASTTAAIKMLTALDERFGDWRLVDMAYNAGPYAVLGALREHPDLGDGAIPAIPVSNTTRKHLAKLMALSCILRQPGHFHVELPRPTADDTLATVEVPAGTRLAVAADMAEIPESRLRALNPGYRGAQVPANSPRILLLPSRAAQSLASALEVGASEPVAKADKVHPADTDGGDDALAPDASAPGQDPGAVASTPVDAKRHRVREGETLWSIARRYHVTVGDLKRWNGLRGDHLQPGELLRTGG